MPTVLRTTVGVRRTGDAPAALAWARYAHLDLWPTWSPYLRRADTDDGSRLLAAGVRGTVHGPPGISARFEVLAVDAAARTWTWHVHRGPVSVVLAHGVEALAADEAEPGCASWLTLTGPGPLVAAYAPVARWALGRLVVRPGT